MLWFFELAYTRGKYGRKRYVSGNLSVKIVK